jgi:hypothetical protein
MIGEGKSMLRLCGFELRNAKVEMNSGTNLSECCRAEIRTSKGCF